MGNCMNVNMSFMDLPSEMHLHIISFMNQESLINMSKTNHYFYNLIKEIPYNNLKTQEEVTIALIEKRYRDLCLSKFNREHKYNAYRTVIKRGIHPCVSSSFLNNVIINACKEGDVEYILGLTDRFMSQDLYGQCLKGLMISIKEEDVFLKLEFKIRHLYCGGTNDIDLITETCIQKFEEGVREKVTVYLWGLKLVNSIRQTERDVKRPIRMMAIRLIHSIPQPYLIVSVLRNILAEEEENSYEYFKYFKPEEKSINEYLIDRISTAKHFILCLKVIFENITHKELIILFEKADDVPKMKALLEYKDYIRVSTKNIIEKVAMHNSAVIEIFVREVKDRNFIIELLLCLCEKRNFKHMEVVWKATSFYIETQEIIKLLKNPTKDMIAFLTTYTCPLI